MTTLMVMENKKLDASVDLLDYVVEVKIVIDLMAVTVESSYGHLTTAMVI